MREIKRGDKIKSQRGRLYEVDHVIHSTTGVDGDDVYASYRLSDYRAARLARDSAERAWRMAAWTKPAVDAHE